MVGEDRQLRLKEYILLHVAITLSPAGFYNLALVYTLAAVFFNWLMLQAEVSQNRR